MESGERSSSRPSATSGAASSPALIGFLGDFELAEEAAQEAFAIAAERWPRDGTPDNPRAWLVTTARNRAIDRIRRDRTLAAKTRAARRAGGGGGRDGRDTTIPDERLELVFTCCHPALALEAQVALTLRTLGGLSDRRDRARVPRPRADDGQAAGAREAQDQRRPGSRSACRPPHLLPDRLAAVLAVVYLIFNEGYGGRGELAAEAIRLGGALAELMPDEPEVHGLLALMLLNDSRRDARFADGRSCCCATRTARSGTTTQIDAGRGVARSRAWRSAAAARTCCRRRSRRCTPTTRRTGRRSPRSTASSPGCTGSPVVELNRAVAIAEAGDVEAALALVDGLELDGYHYLHATRAELLRRLDRDRRGARGLRAARWSSSHSDAERRFLERRLEELDGDERGGAAPADGGGRRRG